MVQPQAGDTFHGMCDGCGFHPVDLRAYERPTKRRDLKWLCVLCANTTTGSIVDAPDSPYRDLMRTICYVANAILAGAKKTEPFDRKRRRGT